MNNEKECCISTRLSNENIICSVTKVEVQIAIELEQPWASVPMKSINFQNPLLNLVPMLLKNKIEAGFHFFAKNELSKAHYTRIFIFKKSASEFEPFKKLELLVPNNSLTEFLPNLIDYIINGKNIFSNIEINSHVNTNELFICTHSERDQCCGKYGLHLYNEFKKQIHEQKNENFRVWQSTHIGGHRYAPTFYEAPTMRWYGLFNEKEIQNFLNRETKNFIVNNNYRGMSGITNIFASLCENELFKKYSWQWLKASDKHYEILENETDTSAKVNFYFKLQNSLNLSKRTFQIRFLKMIEGIASCGNSDVKFSKQYSVTEI